MKKKKRGATVWTCDPPLLNALCIPGRRIMGKEKVPIKIVYVDSLFR